MDDLEFEELDSIIAQINSGTKLAYIPNDKGEEVPLLFKQPSPESQLLSQIFFKKAEKEARGMELPSVEQMEELIKKRGLYTEEDDDKILVLKKRIKGQEAVLSKTTRVPARRDRLKQIISDLQSEINKIEAKKESTLEFTIERKAAEEKLLYLTWRGVRKVFTEELYWPTYEDFTVEKDFAFRQRVFIQYTVFSYGLIAKKMRAVARSNLWRVRYVTALKTGDSLFDRPISLYTSDQLMLLYWSHYYQSVYEMMSDDRPSDEIIEDDDALDAYMKDWQADRNREAVASKTKKKQGKNPSAWDFKETLVMRSNEMYNDIEYSETLPEQAKYVGKDTVDAAPLGRNKKKK